MGGWSVQLGTAGDESYVVGSPDFIERATEDTLTVLVPPPSEQAIEVFHDMIYNIWTGVSDREPDVDYVDLRFGLPSAHLYFPISPYFDPPR